VRLVVLILVILGAGLGWLLWTQYRGAAPPGWQGYAEADFVKVGPVEAGKLTQVAVARGDEVAAGQLLFSQDDTEERAARDQAARQAAQAEQQLANLEAGGKQTEIQQAEANVADARATLLRTQTDLTRGEMLLRKGDATQQSVDQQHADYNSAQAKTQAAEAALAQAIGPLGRQREIEAQHAAAQAAEAALKMAEWRLDQRRVVAPVAGRVADVMARPGETLAAADPVVSILPPQNIFVRFFVPESALSQLHYGDTVDFTCDSCPKGLSGTISFISPQAEFTPPVIYSETSRAKLVYRIEARPPADQAALLNPGQPMEVRIAVAGAKK
jgi:HlyD family secretion protein